jgi:hypothetical protein
MILWNFRQFNFFGDGSYEWAAGNPRNMPVRAARGLEINGMTAGVED